MSTRANLGRARTALVTGASRGIGRAVARALGRAGLSVAVGYHTHREEAEAVVREIAALGQEAVAVAGDVAAPDVGRALVDAAEAALGPVDVLVSNAGSVRPRDLESLSLEEWDRTFNEHLRAAFLLARRAVPAMAERGFGRVIFVSSVAAFTGGLTGPHYAAAKAGLGGLMRSLAAAYAPRGVTVNVVAPALVETDALGGLDADPERLAARIPVGRLGRPEEVAELVLALVRTGYVTGQSLLVDGGLRPT